LLKALYDTHFRFRNWWCTLHAHGLDVGDALGEYGVRCKRMLVYSIEEF
jgi:hypothetical protein